MEQKFDLVVKTLHGLENILATELEQLGAENVQPKVRAVICTGDNDLMYRANLYCRTAIKVLKPIHKFEVSDENSLYRGIQEIEWRRYMNVDDTLVVDGVLNSKLFNHSGFIALRTKDAIVDQFRDHFDIRPSVDKINPTLRINVHISDKTCTVSLDSSGEPLYKRGYKSERNLAPLNEVLAAGLVLLSGWNRESNFADPMCGSGTILIEAALIAYNIPPCILRKEYGFQKWNDFDENIWKKITEEAHKTLENIKKETTFEICGSDISDKAFRIARENINNLNIGKKIRLATKAIGEFVPSKGGGVIVMNPPYGERMKKEDINEFYHAIGDRMKQQFAGYDVWILSSNIEALKNVGLHPTRKITLFNGDLECKFMKYSIYEGSKKIKKPEENN